MSVDRKLRPTLTFLRLHYPECTVSTAMKLCTFSLAGNIMPRVRLLEKHHDDTIRDRWAVATVMGLNVNEFCRKVGVSREEYAAEVASCEADFGEQLQSAEEGDGSGGGRRGGGSVSGGDGGRSRVGGGNGGGGGGAGAGADSGARRSEKRAPPGVAIRSAIQARGSVAATAGQGTAAEETRTARRKKREDEMTARNAATKAQRGDAEKEEEEE